MEVAHSSCYKLLIWTSPLSHIISLPKPPAFHQKTRQHFSCSLDDASQEAIIVVLRYSCLFNLSRALCYWCMVYCYSIGWLWYTLVQCIWWHYVYPPAVLFTCRVFPACVTCEKWHWLRQNAGNNMHLRVRITRCYCEASCNLLIVVEESPTHNDNPVQCTGRGFLWPVAHS